MLSILVLTTFFLIPDSIYIHSLIYKISDFMIEYFLTCLLLLAIYLAYKWIIAPKNQMAYYANLFRKHGFKVTELPYDPSGSTIYNEFLRDQVEKKDPLYQYKHIYPSTDVLVGNMLNRPNIVILNAQILKEIMSPDKVMILPKEKKIIEVFFSILPKGLVAIQGNEWKHRRKLLSKVFTYDLIISHIPMMSKIADQVFDSFEANVTTKNGERELKVDLFEMMVKFTSSVVISGFLGLDSLKEQIKGETIPDALLRLVNLGISTTVDPFILLFGFKFMKLRLRKSDREFLDLKKQLSAVFHTMVKKYEEGDERKEKASTKQKSIVQLLLDESKSNEECSINAEELVDEIKTFTVAGSDTTSTFLTFMLLSIFEKPAIAKKLREQINSCIKSDADLTIDNFKKLHYLACIISQTSRMFSPASGLFQRELSQNSTIANIPVKKGLLIDSTWVSMLYDPKNFENPLDFIPERWQNDENKEHQQLLSFVFSGGPRGCIGKNLALTEIKIMTIKFMQRYGNLIEEGIQDEKIRELGMGMTYKVINSSAILTRTQK